MESITRYLVALPRPTAIQWPFAGSIDARVGAEWSVRTGGLA